MFDNGNKNHLSHISAVGGGGGGALEVGKRYGALYKKRVSESNIKNNLKVKDTIKTNSILFLGIITRKFIIRPTRLFFFLI